MPPENEKLKHIFAHVDKDSSSVKEDEHSINFVISTDKPDRDGDIVIASAVAEAITRKGEFADNPVALACHLHRLSDGMPPAIGSWDISSLKINKHNVQMRLRFADDTQLGSEYWKLYSKGHMRAVSIGFRILDGHEEVKDGKHFYIIEKIELYEISCVAVGANPQAVAKLQKFYSPSKDGDDFAGPEKTDIPGLLNAAISDVEFRTKQYVKGAHEQLETRLLKELDEIKTLIIAEQDGLADKLLTDGPTEQSGPDGGDFTNVGRQLNRLKTVFNNGG